MSSSLRPHRAVLSIFAAAVLATSCESVQPVRIDRNLVFAEQLWQQRQPFAYDITITKNCFCGFEEPGPVVVSVRNGAVISRRYVLSGHLVGATQAASYPTVDDLFVIIEQAALQHSERLEVYYDQVYGYPTSVAIDPRLTVADDESFYYVTDFQPR